MPANAIGPPIHLTITVIWCIYGFSPFSQSKESKSFCFPKKSMKCLKLIFFLFLPIKDVIFIIIRMTSANMFQFYYRNTDLQLTFCFHFIIYLYEKYKKGRQTPNFIVFFFSCGVGNNQWKHISGNKMLM